MNIPETLKTLKGAKINIDYGRGKATFTVGGRKRVLTDKIGDSRSRGDVGQVLVNGLVRFADGTEAYAILDIDESSSGEHWGTAIFIPAKDPRYSVDLVWQDDDDFLARLGKTKDQVFPYKYKYTGEVRALSDHHVGDDGWSF